MNLATMIKNKKMRIKWSL